MDNLDKSCFAYPDLLKYPVHTKEAALNSWATFEQEKHIYSDLKQAEITEQFNKAAAFHEISLEMPKQASVEPDTITFGTADGSVTLSKLAAASDVAAAAAYLLDQRPLHHRDMLKEAAKYVLYCANNVENALDDDTMGKIARLAGIGVGDRDAITYELEKRATLSEFTGIDREEFWNYVNEVKTLSDADFYKEATLNTICKTLEDIDTLYNQKHMYGNGLEAPENVCFGQTLDDLIKEASDLAYIPSIDTTISKKALFERAQAINDFLKEFKGQNDPLEGENLVNKVASLDIYAATALLDAIE